MKPLTRPLALPLGAVLLFAFAETAENPAFTPAKGSTASKKFDIGYEMELDDLSLILDGQDVGQMMGSIEMTIDLSTQVEVTDEYGEVKDGRPLKLKRTFDSLGAKTHISANTDMGGDDQDIPSASALEGETVVFTWNADEGEYDVAFDGDEGDSELLEGLTEDMDLRVFLPAGEVKQDDEWTVEIAALEVLMTPGGYLSLLPEGMDESEMDMDVLKDLFGSDFMDSLKDLYEGQCTCTYKGAKEVDGKRLGEIAFTLEVASAADLSDMIRDVMDKLGSELGNGEMPDFDIEAADFNLDLEGTGTVLWDLSAGRAHSMEVTGDMIVGLDFAFSVEAEGEAHSAEVSLEMSGSFSEKVGIDG